ncbi:leucine-rich_repeat domain-containing protein [Hexamita inflata]|uniref:Leucine-rich repeat domain-containing protein n=1 Tax=Hexamita inflata TaxID=28002 RepID=A0AA86NRJ6_9EUKA|nr:leucine-rich repeat domain-containing protein [Hexamita inflata]
MQLNHKEELLNHFGSSQKLEILDLQQMEKFLALNIPPDVWDDAVNRNLFCFNQQFVQQTKEFRFQRRWIQYFHLVSFLANLTELVLSENKISDISSITKLKNLKKLDLKRNEIEDISALQSLPDLTHIDLSNNKLTSYTLTLPNLVELSISCNKLQDKSGLQHSPKLERLNLFNTETTDLRTIPHQLFGLKNLDLSFNNILDISYLSNFVDLQILQLGYNKQLQNIGPLKFCTQLTELRIYETNVADIWPLQFLINLKTFYMDHTKVVDLHPLQHLRKLEYISASYACIIDVSPLSKLTQLNFLYFWNNKITNRETLKHHQNFLKYNILEQKVPTTEGLKFYSKILSVHSSHQQIKKIMNDNKFRTSLAQKKNYISIMLNNQIQTMNKQVDMLIQIVQNSITYLDSDKII